MTGTEKTAFGRLEASIVLISAAMLMFEILQTVTLSLQTLERNAFLVVSLCLLGLGGGGSMAAWMSIRKSLPTERVLWASALAFGIGAVISGILCSRTVILPLLIILGVVPYVFVGIFLSYVFRMWPERANRSYFMNLTGSALGCTSLLWVLDGTGDAGLTILIIGALAAAASLLLASPEATRERFVISTLVISVLLGLVLFKDLLFNFRPAPRKGMGMIVNNPEIESDIEWSRWGYLGRLDVLRPGKGIEKFPLGGRHTREAMDQGCRVRYLFASGGNWTRAIDFGTNEEYETSFVKHALSAAPFGLKKNPDVLVIGLGGGVDAFLALKHGARSVVAVDINPLMIEAGKGTLASYYDDFYNDPRIKVLEMDGRTYVRNTARKFDVITLMGVDTGAGLHANARVLSENYLYTQEAMDDYLRVLKEDGFVYIARPYWQMMRTLHAGIWALRHRGVKNVQRHIGILGKSTMGRTAWRSLLISKQPMSEGRRQLLLERYPGRVGYLPGYPASEKAYRRFINAAGEGDEEKVMEKVKLDFSRVFDDRPFFYEFGRSLLSSNGGRLLLSILAWVTGIAVVLILLPLTALPRKGGRPPRRLLRTIGYFGAIGAGFMLIEICLIQKLVLFLGHPSYSVSVTLFSILVFAGLGSMVAGKLRPRSRQTAFLIWGPILAAALFYALGLGTILSQTHSDTMWLRVAATVILLAPGSFFMGMPFPTMIGMMRGRDEMLIPWAWAVNAFTSVMASVLSILLAMRFGFTAVIYLGFAFYTTALLLYLSIQRDEPLKTQSPFSYR